MALTKVVSDGIATGAVTSDQIAAGAVTTADLEDSGVTAGTYGSSSAIPAITVDAKGRITSATTSALNVSPDVITEGNTSAEVVDTGSDGHFKVVTEGTEQLRLNAGGDLTLGETAPFGGTVANRRHLTLDAVSDVKIQLGVGGTERQYLYGDNVNLSIVNTQNGYVRINTNNTERLRVANSGAFGLSGGNYGTSGQVLTSQGSGAAPQWATPAGGKILQVVQGSYNTNTTISTNAPSYTSTGLFADITPSATSSKILVIINLSVGMSSSTAPYAGMGVEVGRIVGGVYSTVYSNGGTGYSIFVEQNENTSGMYTRIGYNLVDSPTTTSTTRYQVYAARYTTSSNVNINVGPTANTSHITLMEVAA